MSSLSQQVVNLGSNTVIQPTTQVLPQTSYQPTVNQLATSIQAASVQDQSLPQSSVQLGSSVNIAPSVTVSPLTTFQPSISSLPFVINVEPCVSSEGLGKGMAGGQGAGFQGIRRPEAGMFEQQQQQQQLQRPDFGMQQGGIQAPCPSAEQQQQQQQQQGPPCPSAEQQQLQRPEQLFAIIPAIISVNNAAHTRSDTNALVKDPTALTSSPEQPPVAVTQVHDDQPAQEPLVGPRSSQQEIIEAINMRRRERDGLMHLVHPSSSTPPSKRSPYGQPPTGAAAGVGANAGAGSRDRERFSEVDRLGSHGGNGVLRQSSSYVQSAQSPSPHAASHSSAQADGQTSSTCGSGLKIRIPRDLTNLPEAFRKRGAIRSQPVNSIAPSSQDTVKRTHLLSDSNGNNDRRTKIARSGNGVNKIIIPLHLANVKNLAIRSSPAKRTSPSPPSPSLSATSTADAAKPQQQHQQQQQQQQQQQHEQQQQQQQSQHTSVRHRTSSKSGSPMATPARFPTPPSGSSRAGTETAETPIHMDSVSEASSPMDISHDMETDSMELKPIEIARVGVNTLDRLLSNTYCKSFINKVPHTAANYHVVIKKPMDLTTIERKLWKTLELATGLSFATVPSSATEGYSSLDEFEKDLRRVYQNATFFNSAGHTIYKEAQQYQAAYLQILESFHQGSHQPVPLPHESYQPELVSLYEPGEMERKMTDISTDLFGTFHQPIFDLLKEGDALSPEHPSFVRVYISKSRSILAKCRDEPFAKLAIMSDMYVGKPHYVSAGSPSSRSPGSRNNKTGNSGGTSASMVNVKAKVLIGKPIGDRHDMVTVGDLDCPNAWITVVCVKALEIDVEVPAKFEKGILSKMRHEVVPFSLDSRNNPTLLHDFVDALGVQLTGAGSGTGVSAGVRTLGIASQQRSAVPSIVSRSAAAALAGTASTSASVPPLNATSLGITTASAPASPAGTNNSGVKVKNVRELREGRDSRESRDNRDSRESRSSRSQHRRSKSSSLVEIMNPRGSGNGTRGRLVVKLKLPSLRTAPSSPMISMPPSSSSSTSTAQPAISASSSSSSLGAPVPSAPVPTPASTSAPTQASVPAQAQAQTTTSVQVSHPEEAPRSGSAQANEQSSVPGQASIAPPSSSPTLTAKQESSDALASSSPISTSSVVTVATPMLSSQVASFIKNNSDENMEMHSAPDVVQRAEHLTKRAEVMLKQLRQEADERHVPYVSWKSIEPTLTVDAAHGLFKRIYHVQGQDGIVVQNFKEMDVESFEQRVREVACLLMLRGLSGVGQIQSVIDNDDDHLVGLSMTKYEYTLKAYATNARRHPTPHQKLVLIQEMVSAMAEIHKAGLAHRDLSEVNIMVDEDEKDLLEDQSPRPHIRVIDFGKSVFVRREDVERWSIHEQIAKEELDLLPLVVLPPDHGYKLYRSILTLPKNKNDHQALAPVDPRSEDVYSLGVLIWRTFSGKSPWNGAIEDDLKTLRYLVASDAQIKFQLEREVEGDYSRELLLKCLTADPRTRWDCEELKKWLELPEVGKELVKEFEALGGGRKKVRKSLE
ncbi:Receptor-interacting serine/threonine-protein kinase 1 [Podila epigama]|nr:Receptor-interacting serine/threonine-protein kinase 1 [Podila epigama]